MDFKLVAKIGGALAVLTIVSNLIATLLLGFSIASTIVRIVTAVICLVLGCVFAFLTWRADEKAPKYCYGFAALFNIGVGIMWFFITSNFHLNDAYLNRFIIYYLLLTALLAALACFWPFVTKKVFGAHLVANNFDEKQETLLYVVLAILHACIISLIFCLNYKNSTSISQLGMNGIVYSIGIWFLNALIAFVIAIFIANGGNSKTPASMVTPISADSAYSSVA
ncbi:hypothetical protein TVAG_170210 [Trichomonas vaginalis G3]|uniref:Transmembrane protein n=1 Tax=Trichomonas vaginalis (strain ATCC PRA-98 / G3) TaxID=412133 RepID=A2DPG3_TRIV3|nr:hypothetical protein TVAGG3_0680690 [Trichomonas vaginalis G3]EAY17707.1 hypothetical protein TVAG_170210 [Trichomonas vaginalis G3]KAI5507888.1 hypothetical protein TVAGG3_0680690 [Trichomonas vaginalis G3]|eukprot:XP_001329842.1 hypothetical protein [Trichomonas vaginalis G3]